MASDRDPSWQLRGFARIMRHQPTDAEKLMWSRLRDRQLGGFKFRRQVPIEGFIVDFYCLSDKLAIELDGGQHTDRESIEYDTQRTAQLNKMGIRVLRYSNIDVLQHTDTVLEAIVSALEEPSPLPSPGLPGEGMH